MDETKRTFVECQKIKFIISDILYTGYIRGKGSSSYKPAYNGWIVEVETPKFDSKLYPYSCTIIIECWIQND